MTLTPSLRDALKERAMHCCEVCGKHDATNAHHRVNRSQRKRDTLGNLMLLCGSGTTGCHGRITREPRWAKAQGYTVPSTFEPCDVPLARWSRYTGTLEVVLIDDRGGITPCPHRSPGVA